MGSLLIVDDRLLHAARCIFITVNNRYRGEGENVENKNKISTDRAQITMRFFVWSNGRLFPVDRYDDSLRLF